MRKTAILPRRPAYVPLRTKGAYNAALRAACVGVSGVYVVRRIGKKRPTYVGNSHTGRLWKTMIRHFHGTKSFGKVREFADACGECFEAFVIPSRDEDAEALEARAIRRYRPTVNVRAETAALNKEVPF